MNEFNYNYVGSYKGLIPFYPQYQGLIAIYPQTNRFFTDHGRTIKFWELSSGFSITTIKKQNFEVYNSQNVRDTAISSDGRYYAIIGKSDKVYLWDLLAQKLLREIETYIEPILPRFSNEGDIFILGNISGGIIGWEVKTGDISFELESAETPLLTDIKLSNGNNHFLGFGGDIWGVFDYHRKKIIHSFECNSPVQSVAISNDGQIIAGVTDEFEILIGDIAKGEFHYLTWQDALEYEFDYLNSPITISYNNRIIAMQHPGVEKVEFWDILKEEELGFLRISNIRNMEFINHDNHLFIESANGYCIFIINELEEIPEEGFTKSLSEKIEIFISYSLKDVHEFKISEIVSFLESKGNMIIYYWDRDCGSYQSIIEYMEEKVKTSQIMLAISSENAMNSNAVNKEIDMAVYQNKCIIPIFKDITLVRDILKPLRGLKLNENEFQNDMELLYSLIMK